MHLLQSSGRIANCTFGNIATVALLSEDADGLEISSNHVHDCGDNGIQVWRSQKGEDGTIVSGNRIERIAARSGGSGQYGNGINVFRAGSVLVTQNRISDCAIPPFAITRATTARWWPIPARGSARWRSMRSSASRARSSPTTSSIPPRRASR